MSGNAVKPGAEPRQVEREVEELGADCRRVQELVSDLSVRLVGFVRLVEMPEPSDPQVTPELVPHASHLFAHRMVLRQTSDALRSLLDRLEI